MKYDIPTMSQSTQRQEPTHLLNQLFIMTTSRTKQLLFVLCLIALFVTLAPSAYAIALTENIDGQILGKHLSQFQESAPLATPENIHSSQQDWQPVTVDIPNPGVSSLPTWYRLKLESTGTTRVWMAEVSYPLVERIELLVFHNDDLQVYFNDGNSVQSGNHSDAKLGFEFELPIQEPGHYTLYFRVENRGLLNFPLRLYKSDTLSSYQQNRNLFYGAYTGFLLAVLLYNLAVFIVIREPYLLFFCGFVASYITFFWAHSGIGYRYIWPELPFLEERSTILLGAIPLLFSVLFAANFLKTPLKNRRILVWIKRIAVVTSCLSISMTLLPNYATTLDIQRVATLLIPLLLIITASLSGVLRNPSTMAYSIGIYALAGSIIVHSLARQGIIPTNTWIAYITHIGAVTMIAVHSLAIVLRLYEQRLEQIRTRHDIIATQKSSRQTREKLRASEKNLAQTEAEAKEKSAFLAMMSHEIRTPLNGVLGMVELLQHTRLDAQQKRYLGTISTSGESLLSLLNDILDLSKIESGKMTVEKREVQIIPLINDSILLYSRQARDKNLTLLADIGDPSYAHIYTDEVRLRQVLNNLLNNAIKFTESGHIEIRLEWHNSDLKIHIEDTGIGISEEQKKLLFQSFSQANNKIARQYGGTGLGLTICQKLMSLLDGSIEMTSSPGAGSVFTISLNNAEPTGLLTLPRLDGRRCYLELKNNAEKLFVQECIARLGLEESLSRYDTDCIISDTQPTGVDNTNNLLCIVNDYWPRLSTDKQIERPLRSHVLIHHLTSLLEINSNNLSSEAGYRPGIIWIAEDNLVNQKVIAGMLRHLEMECHIFNNGAQVLSAYEKNGDDVDLILMDCEMPIMDGYDATREIRKRQQQFNRPDLPIIALTANIGVEFEQFARSAGMDDLITKPVRKQTLKNLFTTWLPDDTDTSEITNDNSSER